MEDTEITECVRAALEQAIPGLRLGEIDPNRPFRDQLDLDSVDYLNFVLTVERAFGRRIPELDYPKLSSLSGAVAYLRD